MSSILIVENNDFFRRSFKEILKMYIPGLSISESVDGEDLLDQIDRTCPDVVFMDIRLPKKNGLELTREIKVAHPEQVVSIFTSYDLPEYRVIAERYGANYFLQKDSVSGAEIAAMIKAVASRNRKNGKACGKKKRKVPMGIDLVENEGVAAA